MITTLNFGLSTRSSLSSALVTGENCTILWIRSLSPIGFLGSLSHYDDPPHGVPTSPVRRSAFHKDKSRNAQITYKVFANSKRLWDDAVVSSPILKNTIISAPRMRLELVPSVKRDRALMASFHLEVECSPAQFPDVGDYLRYQAGADSPTTPLR